MELRILLVQADGIIQKVEKMLLENQDAKVDIAINGNIAVQKASESLYDVIVVDPDLEYGFDGFEVILAIRNHTINTKAQFIIVTSYKIPSYALKAIELNINWYIIRPMTTSIVKAAIHWITEQKEREPCFIVHNRHLLKPFK